MSGCGTMWDRVRENEREFAKSSARRYADTGNCPRVLDSLNRATARLDIGPFAEEAIQMRIRCYEKLGRLSAARGHERLLEDFYPRERKSYPKAEGGSVFRALNVEPSDYEAPPSALEIQSPDYNEFARRSQIIGRVVLSFKLDQKDRPKSIRVLEMPHPLLATWAIEAIEKTAKKRKAKDTIIVPGGHYIATFAFEYRWAKAVANDDLSAAGPASR